MKVLLDTCTFLWLTHDAPELSEGVKEIFTEIANEVYLSVVSVWEITVKNKLGKLPLPDTPLAFVKQQRAIYSIETLPLSEAALQHLLTLPDHHRDPFDRMLICQALEHDLIILTSDELIRCYPVKTFW
jgi:PIN domain nuclease of toxin-antitoxin system